MKKKYRLKKNNDFQKVIKQKKSIACPTLIIYHKKNDLGYPRVGISVSKRLGGAVTRNKIKRQLRMIIATSIDYQIGMDYIVIVRAPFLNFDYSNNERDFKYLLKKIIKKGEKVNGEKI